MHVLHYIAISLKICLFQVSNQYLGIRTNKFRHVHIVERSLWVKFTINFVIVDDFKGLFCILTSSSMTLKGFDNFEELYWILNLTVSSEEHVDLIIPNSSVPKGHLEIMGIRPKKYEIKDKNKDKYFPPKNLIVKDITSSKTPPAKPLCPVPSPSSALVS